MPVQKPSTEVLGCSAAASVLYNTPTTVYCQAVEEQEQERQQQQQQQQFSTL